MRFACTGTQVLYNAAAAQPLFCSVRSCARACVPLAQSWLCSTVGGASHCNVAGKLGEQLVKEVGNTWVDSSARRTRAARCSATLTTEAPSQTAGEGSR